MVGRIVFVCQKGRLEAQAILLAASLRIHFPADCELAAAWPSREGALAPATHAALQSLDVGIREIQNPLAADYLIGHKFAALALLAGSGQGLFLDSDMLAMRAPGVLPQGLAAVPASVHHCALNSWQYIYERFDLDFPTSAPPTLLSREETAPYFNTGLVAIAGAAAAKFAACWTDCAQQMDEDPLIPMAAKRPYLDQIAFPVAATKMGLGMEALDEQWNYRGWGWQLPPDVCPIIYHYPEMARLIHQQQAGAAARAAMALTPQVREALQGSLPF